jgi:protein-tyrosine kinase
MASPPKPSLVERLVQERLRTGELEASAAHLLQLGEGAPGAAIRSASSDALSGTLTGDPGMNLLVRPPPIITFRGSAVSGISAQAELPCQSSVSLGPATVGRAPLVPMALSPEARPLATGALSQVGFGNELEAAVAVPPVGPAQVQPAIDLPPASGQSAPAAVPVVTVQQIAPHPVVAPSQDIGQQSDPPQATGRPASGVLAQPATERASERPDLAAGALSVDAVALERGGMVDWSRTRSRISEEFRLVQRQILRSAFGPGAEPGFSNLLLVTSARPGEGKSFTALNLAGSIARQGDNHVLLVDADSKRDSFCYPLGLAENRGLLDLVANPKLDPSPLIVKTPIDRLSILPVGRERERSAELFSTKEMTRLIQSLGRRYADRLLILDAPPCLSTSDPAVLAPVVGQILFVVEADRTQRDEVEASLDLIQACSNITLVLNKQQISSRYTFGAYSSYYSS